MHMVIAFFLICGVLLFIGIVCWLVAIMVRVDTIDYDMAFLWEHYGIDRKKIQYK